MDLVFRPSTRYEPKSREDDMPDPRAELLKGTLDLLILRSLFEAPRHGYGIAQWLEETSQGLLRIEQGSLYPALYRMEDRGWISARWGLTDLKRRAKFYRLTAHGREQLETEERGWNRLVKAISLILQPQEA
jgi:transcriptional regulator